MIILPDRKISRSQMLMAVPRREWMRPSQAEFKDQFENPGVRTMFRLTARLHDGHVVWRGWFEDRDEADAFLFALASGSLRYERELWRAPTPAWHPGLGENLSYHFATVTFLTTTGGATYTSPSDWNNSNNTIEGLGAGGSGGAALGGIGNGRASGGGGGEYRKISNFTFATPGTTTASYTVGTGGPSTANSTAATYVAGTAGTDTTFNTTSLVAKGGGAGQAASSGTVAGGTGGTGGTGAAGNADGGTAASVTTSASSTGGGGAGGPNGAGNAGAASSGSAAVGGGSGDAGSGGSGGTASGGTGGAGGNGTEFQVSPAYGSGGGGAGAYLSNATPANAGAGGNYGGGGGGATIQRSTSGHTATSGAGIQGLIVITYTPAAAGGVTTNLAMLGM